MLKIKNNFYQYAVVLIIGLGILLRCIYFFKNISLFSDEAMLAQNIFECNYAELFGGLKYLQVAPPIFLIASKFLIDIFCPQTDYLFDLTLRIIPFLCGILALLGFNYFLKILPLRKTVMLFALFLLSFNPAAILYCGQFKQYSTEMFVSVILLIIFYKIITQNEFKKRYAIIISIAPWFSLSSLFIIASGFLFLIFKKNPNLLKYLIPFCLSFILFCIFYLKSVYAVNYSGMDECWSSSYGFLDFHHPLRPAIRVGEFFYFNKLKACIIGFYFLILAITPFFNKNNFFLKMYLAAPILLTATVSLCHHWPIEARLLLFLLPIFCCLISSFEKKIKLVFLIPFCLISFYLSVREIILPKYDYSARESVEYLKQRITPQDILILDLERRKYEYYLRNNKIKTIYIDKECRKDIGYCNEFIEKLPQGTYYLLTENLDMPKLTKSINIQDIYIKKSNLIKFNPNK